MALCKCGQGITTISGKFGGSVFRKSENGSCICGSIGRKTNKDSIRQQNQQKAYQICIYFWNNTLSAQNRSLWNEIAKNQTFHNRIGETYRPTGYNYFLSVNLYRTMNTLDPIAIPPV